MLLTNSISTIAYDMDVYAHRSGINMGDAVRMTCDGHDIKCWGFIGKDVLLNRVRGAAEKFFGAARTIILIVFVPALYLLPATNKTNRISYVSGIDSNRRQNKPVRTTFAVFTTVPSFFPPKLLP